MLDELTTVLTSHAGLIFSILAIIFTGMLVSVRLLGNVTDNSFTSLEYFSLGMSAWLIPVLLMALPASRLLQIPDALFRIIAIIIFIAVILLLRPGLRRPLKTSTAGWLFFLLLIISTAANLLFLSRILLPAYFDSVEHYRIIGSLLQGAGEWPTSSYYHIGYHLILAVIIKLTGATIVDVMLVSGQLAISTLAIPLFFIISRETRSGAAALFTTALGAFGWYMPEHAVNWGKYPALFGFSVTILVFGLIYLISRNLRSWLEIKKLTLLFAALTVCGVLHTRAVVACGLFAASLFLADRWDVLDSRWKRFILGAFLLALTAAVMFLRTDATFSTLFFSYLDRDIPGIFLILFLGIFALWKFPRLTFALLLLVSMAVLCLYVPVNGLLGYENLYLLDRPYTQILLYIPFSFIGGLGFAGLREASLAWTIWKFPVTPAVQLTAFLILVVNAIFYQQYYPAACCKLAGTDDLAAFSWIEDELPPESVLLIAYQNLSFTPDATRFSFAGIDAGVWVSTMTEKGTFAFPSDTDFTQASTLKDLCGLGIDYIYVGNLSGSFNESHLIAKTDWYQAAFMLPEVKIYQLIGCPPI